MWWIKPEDMDLIAGAKRFMVNYYRTFDENRAGLVNLYREESVLALDGGAIKGKEAILAKFMSLPQCQHEIADFKCMPHRAPGSVLVWVYGETWVGGKSDKADAVVSNQMFVLMPTPEGSFCVGTQIWKPIDLNKLRTPLAAPALPMSTFAIKMSMLRSASAPALPPPLSVFAFRTAMLMSNSTSPAYVSPPLPISASASSESTLALHLSRMKISTLALPMSVSASSESTLALPMPMSMMKISTSALPMYPSASSESALVLPMSMMKISTSAPPHVHDETSLVASHLSV